MSSDGREQSFVTSSMTFAALITIGLCLYTSYKHFLSKIFLLVITFFLLVPMVRSGSRSAILAFMIGSSAYVLPHWRSKRTWIAIVLVIFSFVAVLYISADNSAVLERWLRTYYEGDLSGRDEIYAIAGDMILEKPVLGWSVAGNYELGRREGGRFFSIARSVHNNFLELLLNVGIVGATPFLVGLWLCGRSAWRARRENLGLLPLALLLTNLGLGMSASMLISKPTWLILALTLAAGPSMPRELAAVTLWARRNQQKTGAVG